MSTYSSMNVDVAELEKIANQWERRCIYKLPPCVTKISETAYTPQIVSFGPYHYKDENLQQMESHKQRAVNQFLKRSKLKYGDCHQTLMEIVEELMDAYDWLDLNLYSKKNPDAFLEIMICDGIFMLEIFGDGDKRASGYAENDPIFSEHGDLYVIPHVKRDMLMLENQIPMKVLHKLYQLQYRDMEAKYIHKVIFEFFFPDKIASAAPHNRLHILDMYRTVILGSYHASKRRDINIITSAGEDIIRSAVELSEAGIKIKKSTSSTLRDISFENGVLRLPMIVVHDTTESMFLNLIAYERFHVGAGNDVSAYVFFMDSLIQNAQDIKLLHYNDIVDNGNDKAVAKMFNSLSKNVCLDNGNPLLKVHAKVNLFANKRVIPKRRALRDFCDTYFTKPWAIITFIAGIILFGLTATQTSYAVMDFHKTDNNGSH